MPGGLRLIIPATSYSPHSYPRSTIGSSPESEFPREALEDSINMLKALLLCVARDL